VQRKFKSSPDIFGSCDYQQPWFVKQVVFNIFLFFFAFALEFFSLTTENINVLVPDIPHVRRI
jgi:hypothetical protein